MELRTPDNLYPEKTEGQNSENTRQEEKEYV